MSAISTTRVLLADDEERLVSIMAERLRTRGLEVEIVFSGEDAVKRVEEMRSYHSVVLDLSMPGIGGLEALRRIRRIMPTLPVIILTGQGTADQALEAVTIGAFDYLHKPVDINALLAKILEAKRKAVQEKEQ